MKNEIVRSTIAGLIAMAFALIAVYIVHLIGIKFNEFSETLISVGIASFISGFCGWYFAKRRQ